MRKKYQNFKLINSLMNNRKAMYLKLKMQINKKVIIWLIMKLRLAIMMTLNLQNHLLINNLYKLLILLFNKVFKNKKNINK